MNLALGQQRLHARQRRFHDHEIALVLEIATPQRCPQCDVDGAAYAVGGKHLAFQVVDRVDRTVLEHQVMIGKVAGNIALEVVGDGAQIIDFRILDCQRER